MKRAVIIADDLSGANDVGCKVFENGFKCAAVDASKQALLRFLKIYKGIPIINTASRMLSSASAYKAVYAAAFPLRKYGLIYKKLDSTLRGNIGAELDACIDALKIRAVALVPAFPELKRRTIYGRHFLNGKVLENTEYAHDPVNRLETSDIFTLLKQQSKNSSILVDIDIIRQGADAVNKFINSKRISSPVIFYFDCINNSDMRIIAESLKDFKVIAGASALAGYVFPKKRRIVSVYPKTNKGNVYLVGSVKDITHRQVSKLSSLQTIPVFPVLSNIRFKAGTKDLILSVKMIRKAGNTKMRRKIEAAFRRNAVELVNKLKYGRLFITGGATAEIIFKALKINYTEIKDVLFAGVPLTYSPERNIYVVTKPGGFGDADALLKIHARLKILK